MPAEPSDFLAVAEMLSLEGSGELGEADQVQLWLDCEDARARSAVSRGYYAAFRVLKSRLLPRRDEWRKDPKRFPSIAVHYSLKKALETYLTDKHPVVREIKGLLHRRNVSDYDLAPEMTCQAVVADLVGAECAIDGIENLTDEQLDGIAHELQQMDAAMRARVAVERRAGR